MMKSIDFAVKICNNKEKDVYTKRGWRYYMSDEVKKSKKRERFVNLPQAFTIMLVIGTGLLIFFALYRFDAITEIIGKIVNILAPIMYGLGIAYILNPIMVFWEKKAYDLLSKKKMNQEKAKKASRNLGIIISLLLACAVLFVLFYLVIPELIATIYGLVSSIPQQLEEFEHYITGLMDSNSEFSALAQTIIASLTDWFEGWLKNDLFTQVSGITTGIFNVVNVLIDIIFGFIISVYILAGKDGFISKSKMIVYACLSRENANVVLEIARKSNHIFSGFISGKLIDSLIIGVLCFVGMSILQMPYAILVSVIIGVTNVIPFFGPYIGAIPSAFLILLANPMQGLYFCIFILVLQQLDGNVIGPKILGEFTGLTAFWVVFAILLGGGLFGFMGMLLGVPVFAVIYYIAGQIIEHVLKQKNLPILEEKYSDLHRIEPDLTLITNSEVEEEESAEEDQKKN